MQNLFKKKRKKDVFLEWERALITKDWGDAALLLEEYPEDLDLSKNLKPANQTALGWCILWQKHELVEKLIKARAPINTFDGMGNSPLMVAARVGDLNLVNVLIDAGADVNLKGPFERRALLDVMERRDKKVALFLIEKGANVNVKSEIGVTPLMFGVYDRDLVEVLIREGADLHAKDQDGTTVLMHAAQAGALDSIQVMFQREKELHLNAQDQWGVTALMFAALCGEFKVFQWLWDQGADVELKDSKGRTVFDLMAKDNDEVGCFLKHYKESLLLKQSVDDQKSWRDHQKRDPQETMPSQGLGKRRL